MPENEDIGHDADGIPTPFLGSVGMANSREETSKDPDEVGNDGEDGVSSINTSEKAQLESENGKSKDPVDVASPVDLTANLVVGVGHMLVVVAGLDAVESHSMTGSHGKVGESGNDGHQGGQEVKDSALNGDVPREAGEDGGGNDHNDKDNPQGAVSIVIGSFPVSRLS